MHQKLYIRFDLDHLVIFLLWIIQNITQIHNVVVDSTPENRIKTIRMTDPNQHRNKELGLVRISLLLWFINELINTIVLNHVFYGKPSLMEQVDQSTLRQQSDCTPIC